MPGKDVKQKLPADSLKLGVFTVQFSNKETGRRNILVP